MSLRERRLTLPRSQSKGDHVLHRMSQELGIPATLRIRAVVTRFAMITRSGETPPWWRDQPRLEFAACSRGSRDFDIQAADDVITRLGQLQVLVDALQNGAVERARAAARGDKRVRDSLYDRARKATIEAVWRAALHESHVRDGITDGAPPDEVIDAVAALGRAHGIDAEAIAAVLIRRVEEEADTRLSLEDYTDDQLAQAIEEGRPPHAPDEHRPSPEVVRGTVAMRVKECARMNQSVTDVGALVNSVATIAWYPAGSPFYRARLAEFWTLAGSPLFDKQIRRGGVHDGQDRLDVRHDAMVEAVEKVVNHIHRAECGLVEDTSSEAMTKWFISCLRDCVAGAIGRANARRGTLAGTPFEGLDEGRPSDVTSNPLAVHLAYDKSLKRLPSECVDALFSWADDALYSGTEEEILGLLAEHLEHRQSPGLAAGLGGRGRSRAEAWTVGITALEAFKRSAGSGRTGGGEQ